MTVRPQSAINCNESKNSNQLICFLLHAACKFIMVGHFYANVLNTLRCRPSEMILVKNTIQYLSYSLTIPNKDKKEDSCYHLLGFLQKLLHMASEELFLKMSTFTKEKSLLHCSEKQLFPSR